MKGATKCLSLIWMFYSISCFAQSSLYNSGHHKKSTHKPKHSYHYQSYHYSHRYLYPKNNICTSTCVPIRHVNGPVEERVMAEENLIPNYFFISFYKPNYVLPFYYTGSPDNGPYVGNTPNNETLKKSEVKYQLSFKVPLWQNIFDHPSSIYFGYTQLAYWQLYNHKPFFRETDYEPELFATNEINYPIGCSRWHLNFVNVGLAHQSNGYGNSLERSWNRLYLDGILSNDNWMISIKPWYILTTNGNNRNIHKFLGYGRVLASYKIWENVISIEAHNLIESNRHATAQLTWSFPITPYIKGYVQGFSGYGQSLVEYNHRTNSFGVGLALSDWL